MAYTYSAAKRNDSEKIACAHVVLTLQPTPRSISQMTQKFVVMYILVVGEWGGVGGRGGE